MADPPLSSIFGSLLDLPSRVACFALGLAQRVQSLLNLLTCSKPQVSRCHNLFTCCKAAWQTSTIGNCSLQDAWQLQAEQAIGWRLVIPVFPSNLSSLQHSVIGYALALAQHVQRFLNLLTCSKPQVSSSNNLCTCCKATWQASTVGTCLLQEA